MVIRGVSDNRVNKGDKGYKRVKYLLEGMKV